MADAKTSSAKFQLTLEDETSGPALTAASALKQLRGQIDEDTKALAGMQKAMKNLQKGSSVNVEQFRALKKQIDEKRESIAKAQSAYLSLGGSFTKASNKGAAVKSMMERLAEQTRSAGGPVGSLSSRFSGLHGVLSGGGGVALAITGVAVAVAAVTAAMLAGVAALARYAVGQADARRSELLRLEGLVRIRSIYGFVRASAADLQASIDQVTDSTVLGRDQVGRYAEQLHRAGLRGQTLTDALEGMAIKAATQGEAQASLFAGMAAGAAFAGRSVKKLSDDVKARLGGIAKAQLLSLSAQAAKARDNFGAMFRDLKIEPFLTALKTVTDLFSQSTASGRALKSVLSSVVQSVANGIAAAAPIVKNFIRGAILGFLAIEIAALRVALFFKRTFGANLTGGLKLAEVALTAGKVAAGLFAAALIPVAAAVALVSAAVGVISAQIFVASKIFSTLYGLIKNALAFDWAELGRSIVDGVISGIRGRIGALVDSVKFLGKSALDALKSALGIASPSKAFAKLGVEIPRGVTAGIDAGAPGAQSAAESIVTAPTGGAFARGGRSVTISIGDVHVNASGGDSAGIAGQIKAELERILEGVAVQIGAMPGSAA